MERNASVYHVYPICGTTGEERAECSKGADGAGGGGVRTALGGTNVSFCSELAIGVVLNDGAGCGGDMNGSYGMDG